MRRRKVNTAGFTLIELVIVVLIVGVMAGIAVTRVDFLVPKYRLRGAAREVAAVLKQGKARAAATGKDVYFEADLSQGTYWLLVAFPIGEPDPGVERRPLEYQPVFSRELPAGVQFTDFIFSDKEKIASGHARLKLSPFGVSAHTIVNLRNDESRELAVKLNGLTGALSYREGYKDADELLEDAGP